MSELIFLAGCIIMILFALCVELAKRENNIDFPSLADVFPDEQFCPHCGKHVNVHKDFTGDYDGTTGKLKPTGVLYHITCPRHHRVYRTLSLEKYDVWLKNKGRK